MAQHYRSTAGDTVDFIAWKHYGTQDGQVVEQLLAANPALADYGPELPAGVIVSLPGLTAVGQSKGVRLWD